MVSIKRHWLWLWVFINLVVLFVVLNNKLCLVILPEDVGIKHLVVPPVALAEQLGLAVLLDNVGNELRLGVPLTTLAVSIGCCDIGQGLRSEDDVNCSSNPPQPRVQVREINSRRRK
jgi:hypothetical protein